MHKRRGFTLIGLIIVITIIAVLAAILAPVMARVRQAKAIAALDALRTAAKLYYSENVDMWPATMAALYNYVPQFNLLL